MSTHWRGDQTTIQVNLWGPTSDWDQPIAIQDKLVSPYRKRGPSHFIQNTKEKKERIRVVDYSHWKWLKSEHNIAPCSKNTRKKLRASTLFKDNWEFFFKGKGIKTESWFFEKMKEIGNLYINWSVKKT